MKIDDLFVSLSLADEVLCSLFLQNFVEHCPRRKHQARSQGYGIPIAFPAEEPVRQLKARLNNERLTMIGRSPCFDITSAAPVLFREKLFSEHFPAFDCNLRHDVAQVRAYWSESSDRRCSSYRTIGTEPYIGRNR